MIDKLPEHILIEIFRLLDLKQVIRLQRINKAMNSLFKLLPMILFNTLRGLYKSPFFPSGVRPTYQGVKRLYSKIHYSKIIMLQMLAFSTNGGYLKNDPFESMINVFSSNLFDSCYNAVRNQNVLIKALFCGGKFTYSVNRGDWEKKGLEGLKGSEGTEIELTGLKEKLEQVLKNTCKDILLTGFYIEMPSFLSKSSFKTCIIFSSQYLQHDLSLIHSFSSLSTAPEVQTLAESYQIQSCLASKPTHDLIQFSQTSLPLRPLCWIQFLHKCQGSEVLELELEHHYMGCYLYILFIDAFDTCSGGLDVGTFIAKGKIITLYE